MSEQPTTRRPGGRELALVLGGAGLIVIAALALYLRAERGDRGDVDGGAAPRSAAGSPDGPVTGLPPLDGTPIALKLDDGPVRLAALIDVRAPAKLRQALQQNAWLTELASSPLYAGFWGSWQGFFATRGEDLGNRFSGTVFDLVSERLLGGAFRVLLFGGAGSARVPAVVIEAPSARVGEAFALLDGLARRGSYQVEGCPASDADEARPAPSEVARWLVADRALYAARQADRIVLASQPLGVVHGACAALPAMTSGDGVDLEIELRSESFGRGAQALQRLLGIQGHPRVALAVEGERLVPRGLRASQVRPGHLKAGALDEKLLKLVPADVEVLATLQLDLPATLDAARLKILLEGGDPGPRLARQVALLWTPHGTRALPTEVAVLWSRVEDAPALTELFGGGNTLAPVEICGALVLASTPALRERVSRSCHGQAPSLLSAAPAVVQGLRAPQSVGVTVNLGRVLWVLTEDAYRQERLAEGQGAAVPVLPRELDAASKLLLGLPTVGFTGLLQGTALTPGGFRS